MDEKKQSEMTVEEADRTKALLNEFDVRLDAAFKEWAEGVRNRVPFTPTTIVVDAATMDALKDDNMDASR